MTRIAYIILIHCVIIAGCTNEINERVTDHDNQDKEKESFYSDNNKLAIRRVESIMYSKVNGSNPSERFKIVHISDPHLSPWSLDNNYISPTNLQQSIQFANQKRLRINAIVATGDYLPQVKSEKDEAFAYLNSFVSFFYKENYVPSFLCTGNHDCDYVAEDVDRYFIRKEEISKYLFARDNYKRTYCTNENYYYSDIPNPQGGMIRIIALDVLDQPGTEYNTLKNASFSQKQVDWLSNVALKEQMTDSHSVIILTHFPFVSRKTDPPTLRYYADHVYRWNMIPEIVEAFRNRAVLRKTFTNNFKKGDIQANYDFTDCKGEFVCYLGGHLHCNAYFPISELENATHFPPQMMILCTNQAPSETGGDYNYILRKADSTSSNSFCIYAIDTKEKKVYITYFGAYKPSNDPNYPEINTFSYL